MKRAATALWLWLALLVSLPAGQQLPSQPPPTFRTGVDAVQLDVSVLDKQRRPVRGLTAADFTVLEEGKPREIVAFSAIELPPMPAALTPSGADTVPPDVSGNDSPQGRLVVILIDPFLERVMVPGRVTIADPPGITALRATAHRIVDSLGSGDLAAVGHTIYGGPQNFTTDKARLKRAIDSSAFGTHKRADGTEWGNCHCGVCRLEAITSVATALRAERQRRKTLFFIGERVQLAPVSGSCNSHLEPATKEMMHATQLANVTVHTVDPNSLETTNVRAGDDFKPEPAASEAAAAQERANRAFLIERHQTLQTVAEWTGGRAILNTNNPEESVRPILEESSAYYLLAFQVSDAKPDGRFRPITVKVNRPDVQVRTRKGYYADAVSRGPVDAARSAPLEEVARALLPERGLPMTITAAPFRGATNTAVLVVATGVRASASPNSSATHPEAPPQFDPIEILSSAFRDGEKDFEWQRQRLSVAMPEGAPGELRYESISTLNLKPGRYEVRVAIRHDRADAVGSVHTFVDVPDFNSQPLMLSGVVLLDSRAPTATPAEALAGVLDIAPTTRRDFTSSDDVSALVRAYQKLGAQPTAVTVVFRILDRALSEVTATPITLMPEQFSKSGGADARFAVPLDTLSPGSYVLRIEASAAGAASVRDVRFTVR